MEDLHRNLYILSHLLERIVVPESLNKGGNGTLSKPQYDTLLFVQNHPDARPSELAKAFGISAPTVTNLLQRMERKGLLQKTPAEDDQRSVTLALTSLAHELLGRVDAERQAMLVQLVQRMPSSDQVALEQGLDALIQAASQIRTKSELCLQCGNAHTDRCVLGPCD